MRASACDVRFVKNFWTDSLVRGINYYILTYLPSLFGYACINNIILSRYIIPIIIFVQRLVLYSFYVFDVFPPARRANELKAF